MQYKNHGDTTILYSVLKAIVIMLTKNQNRVYFILQLYYEKSYKIGENMTKILAMISFEYE